MRKLMDWHKDSLTEEEKAAYISNSKQGIHSPLPTGRQVFSRLQESRAPSCVTVIWEDKHHSSECPPSPSASPHFTVLSMMSYGMGYPFGQLGLAVPAMSPPSFLCTPSLLAGEEQRRPLCKHCSAITKISMYYQHCFQHKSITQLHTSYYEES